MLERIDRIAAPVVWVIAAALAIMLLAGPQVIAEDKAQPGATEAKGASPYAAKASSANAPAAAAADGKALFTDSCGGCHTLATAGTSGSLGPPLDDVGLDAEGIETVMRDGRGTMPSFDGELSDDEITAVAAFVAGR